MMHRGRHSKQPADRGQSQAVKDHVKAILRQLTSWAERPIPSTERLEKGA